MCSLLIRQTTSQGPRLTEGTGAGVELPEEDSSFEGGRASGFS